MSLKIIETSDGKKYVIDDADIAAYVAQNGKPYVPDPVLSSLAPMTREEYARLTAGDPQALTFIDMRLQSFNALAAQRLAEYKKANPTAV